MEFAFAANGREENMLNTRKFIATAAFGCAFALANLPTPGFALTLGGFTFDDAQFGNLLVGDWHESIENMFSML